MPAWLITTSDRVEAASLADLCEALRAVGPVDGPHHERVRGWTGFRPEWVQVVADAFTWQSLLQAGAIALFGKVIASATAKPREVLRELALKAVAGDPGFQAVRQIGAALAAARERLGPSAKVRIALPVPDDYFCAAMEVNSTDLADVTYVLVLFSSKAALIEEHIRRAERNGMGPSVGVRCEYVSPATIRVHWTDDSDTSHNIDV